MRCDIGQVSPCHLFHETMQVCGLVHGGEFVFREHNKYLEDIVEHMVGKLKTKTPTRSTARCTGS